MLAWMDLEMTGLNPAHDVIVEIATLVTDDDLEIIAEGPDLVVHQPPDVLARMGDTVRRMHTASGLLDEIAASTTTLEEAGASTLAFLREHIPEARTVPLCGNSIGTDRRFLGVWLPEIEEFLHTHPDVEDVQVIGVPDERYGEELCAWLKLREGAEPLDAAAVRAFCEGRLAHFKIPRYVLVVEEFPMTVTGKIRKVEMREETTRLLEL